MARQDKGLRIPNAYTGILQKSRRREFLRTQPPSPRILNLPHFISRALLPAPYFPHPGLNEVSTLAFAEMVQKYGALVEPQEKYCCSADWSELRKVL